MKRNLGVGDIVIALGLLLIFAFMLINIVSEKDLPTWGIINGVVLMVLTAGAGGIFALSLIGNPKMMNILYVFSGFMILLHLNIINAPSYYSSGVFGGGPSGRVFYVFVGALLVGIGTYMAQQGGEALTGEKKK